MMQPPLPTRNPIVPQPATPQPQPSAGWDMNAPVSAFYGQPQDAWAQGMVNAPTDKLDAMAATRNRGGMPFDTQSKLLDMSFQTADKAQTIDQVLNTQRAQEIAQDALPYVNKTALATAGTQSPGMWHIVPDASESRLLVDMLEGGYRTPNGAYRPNPDREERVFVRDIGISDPSANTLPHEAMHGATDRMLNNKMFRNAMMDILAMGGANNDHAFINSTVNTTSGVEPNNYYEFNNRRFDKEQFMKDASVALNPHPALSRAEDGSWAVDKGEIPYNPDRREYMRAVLAEQLAQHYLAQTKPRGPR